MTNILFVHPNYPGQFKHIIPALRETGEFRLAYISRKRSTPNSEGILIEQYQFEKKPRGSGVHRYLHHTNEAIRESREVSVSANNLISRGFVPDIIVGHTSWGGLMFMRDMFPQARIIGYCELYSSPEYDHATPPGQTVSNDHKAFLRCRNLHGLMQMEAMDIGITPTEYQRQSHPALVQKKLLTVHEGVDTEICAPDPDAAFPIKERGLTLTRSDQVLTYVSRGFEPVRGFFQYMEAVEILCKELPEAHFLFVGGDNVFYSRGAGEKNYREQALEKYQIDRERVHFTGRLTHEGFRKVIQISSAHTYLTRPLFLSWSAVEAMSMAAPIVASDEKLVREFMRHEENALLVDYFNPRQIADSVLRLVNDHTLAQCLGSNARKMVVEHLDIRHTVNRWMEVIREQQKALSKG
ncbi:MAG: glycosyltransferase [Acidiferrobacterales bacterium]|nr:glycosyltransferase [Acidiferrobacterales bacterium]